MSSGPHGPIFIFIVNDFLRNQDRFPILRVRMYVILKFNEAKEM